MVVIMKMFLGAFLIICILTGIRSQELIFYNMTFFCGVDICIVPKHFCNTVTSTCEICNSDICNGENIDPMCNYVCVNLKRTTTPKPTKENKKPEIEATCTTFYAWQVIVLGIACGIEACIIVAIIAYKYSKTLFRCRKKSETGYSLHETEIKSTQNIIEDEQVNVKTTRPPLQRQQSRSYKTLAIGGRDFNYPEDERY